jgi:ubiquinone/menaquinone biosynthesis C-methylase UbiE
MIGIVSNAHRPLQAVLTAAVLSVPLLLLAQAVPSEEGAQHLHQDPKAYIAALDDPARDAWQKPREVVTALGLREGDTVADIGAGSGYFALRFAHHVGSTGKVLAVDLSPDMIAEVKRRAAEARLTNVTPVLAKPDDPQLPAGAVDVVFLCDTWHHIEQRGRYLATLRPALKPGARLVIVDFRKDAPVGPPASMKLTREEVVKEVEAAGFELTKEHTFLPHQYFLEFSDAGRPRASPTGPGPDSSIPSAGATAAPIDWRRGDALDAAALAAALRAGGKPTVVYVGFKGLAHAGRIPGAVLHGPASQPDGIADLRRWAQARPRHSRVVLYCGCCPMEHCPNVTPAFKALREMGFTDVQVLVLPTNFATDWVQQGFPIERN